MALNNVAKNLSQLRKYEKRTTFIAQELHIYEMLKFLIEVIRKKCNIKQLQQAIEEKEHIKFDGMRKTKYLKFSYPKFSNCTITVRLIKLCNCFLTFDSTFSKNLRQTKEKQAKILAKIFLKNYVIGSLDIKNYFFG